MADTEFMNDTPYEEHMFSGKLITSRDAFLVGKENYVEMRNMRYSPGGIGIETRYGMRRFNNTAVASGGDIEKLWQHLYTRAQTRYADLYAVTDEKKLYKADSIPESSGGAGSLGSSLFDFTAGSSIPSFTAVGDHAICTGKKELIGYDGSEPYCVAFLYGTDIGTADTAADEDNKIFQIATDEVTDNLSTTFVTITLDTQANNECLYVGYWQPVDGINFTMGTNKNATGSATLTVEYWNGAAWTTVGAITDGTEASADTPFSQTGSITWTYITAGTEKPRRINGQTLFWYRIQTDVTLDNADFEKITVNKDWRGVEDLTDGYDVTPSGFIWLDDGDDPYHDLLDRVITNTKGTYASFVDATADEDLAAADELYIGFPIRVMGFKLFMYDAYHNDGNASTMTVSYWNGTSWTAYAADEISDGTTKNSKTLNQTGEIRLEDKGTSVKITTLANQGIKLPMYWYKVTFSAKMYNDTNDEMRIWRVTGVPGQRTLEKYNWVSNFKDRLFLFGPEDAPSTADFSAYLLPYALSGEDTSSVWPRIRFGHSDDITCAVPFFNEMAVFKRSETWIMEGDSPDTFGNLLIDNTIGCVAPDTAHLVRTWVSLPDGRQDFRNAVFFQAYDGVYAVDAIRVWKISQDIDNYFDPVNSEAIKSTFLDDSTAFFDPIKNEYHLFIWSGSTPDMLEFIYNTELQRWSGPFIRLTVCECGISCIDSNEDRLSYGGGTDGRVYRLENGTNDVYTNGTAGPINNWVEMGDHWSGLLGKYAAREVFLFGKAQAAGSVTLELKGEGQTTAAGLGTTSMVSSGYATFIGRVIIGDQDSAGAAMENKFHAHRMKFSTNTAGVRQELYGWNIKKKVVGEAAS